MIGTAKTTKCLIKCRDRPFDSYTYRPDDSTTAPFLRQSLKLRFVTGLQVVSDLKDASINMTALRDLPVEQRLHLVEELWDSIAADQGALELTDAQRRELDNRLDTYEIDRNPGRPLEDVLADIRKRL